LTFVVFIASSHPLWWMVRRSMHLLTGAVMLTAVLSSGPTRDTISAEQPAVTASTAVNPVLEDREFTAIYAEPAGQTVHVATAEQLAPVALKAIGVLSGRTPAAALGERAPPRL
jgi:hypothetical protein